MFRRFLAAAALPLLCAGTLAASGPVKPKLHVQEIAADSSAFDVVSTLIIGPKNVLLFDAQYHLADARRVADAIQATGKHLQAIIISHPDEDHYTGAAAIVERFPGTPVYMTRAALEKFRTVAAGQFKRERAGTVPDSLVTPQELPSTHITLDGETIEVIPDLTGDNPGTNSALWIPSIKTVLAGDLVFDRVHAWLAAGDSAARAAWLQSLQKLQSLHPDVVVPGHRKDASGQQSVALLQQMSSYLTTFDSIRLTSKNAQELRAGMLAKYQDYAVPMLLGASSASAFRNMKAAASSDQWTGTLHTPDGNVIQLTYDVVLNTNAPSVKLNVMGQQIPANNTKWDGVTLSFSLPTPSGMTLNCELQLKEPGRLAGECKGPDGNAGQIEMIAPK